MRDLLNAFTTRDALPMSGSTCTELTSWGDWNSPSTSRASRGVNEYAKRTPPPLLSPSWNAASYLVKPPNRPTSYRRLYWADRVVEPSTSTATAAAMVLTMCSVGPPQLDAPVLRAAGRRRVRHDGLLRTVALRHHSFRRHTFGREIR